MSCGKGQVWGDFLSPYLSGCIYCSQAWPEDTEMEQPGPQRCLMVELKVAPAA